MIILRKSIISVFITFNILAMVRIHMPLSTPYFSMLYRPIDVYLSFFSLYQDWMMFSPDPSRTDTHILAQIEFTDGTKATYDFEKPENNTYLEKYLFGEKFRKLTSEGIRKDSNSFMWKDAARFALRKIGHQNYSKTPQRISLSRMWKTTPAIHDEFRKHGEKISSYERYQFYTLEVP